MAGQAGASAMFGKLVNGELRCVVSTNKLMAGIDIGDLDVSVVSGFQFRFSDMRQMLGRAARKSSGAWVFFGDPNSLEDLYVMDSFPDVFECKNPEACVVSVKNKRLAAAHFRCVNGFLARPWQQEGPAVARLTRWLFPVVGGKPETDGHTDPWKAPPLEGLQMRGANVRDTYGFVFEGSVEAQEDPYKVQERIAFRDFHPGAIVDIGDAVYECTTLTPHPVCRVHVKAVEDLGIRTKAVEVVQARRVSDGVSATRGRVQLELADWKVRVAVERYDRLRRIDSWACPIDGCAVVGGRGGRCPRHKRRLRYSEDWRPEGAGEIVPALDCEVETVGVRLTLPMSEFLLLHPSVEHEAIGSGAILKGVIVALLNAFREVFLVETDVLDGAVLGAEEILLFDDFPGGLGICENVFFDGNDTLLRSAAARVEKCKCPRATGCMACTLPKHSFEGDAARKEDVLAFLRLLTDAQELPAEPVREGNVVLHRHYGCGTVLVAEHRAGIGFCVTVQFAEPHGRRTVLGTYLQRVGASRGSLRAMPRDGAVEEEGVEEGR